MDGDDIITPGRGNAIEISSCESTGMSRSREGISGRIDNVEKVPSSDGRTSDEPRECSFTTTQQVDTDVKDVYEDRV